MPVNDDLLKAAACDVRYLSGRGYPVDYAVRFVADHYRLPQTDRYVLMRVVVPPERAAIRRSRAVSLDCIRGSHLAVDGYNVLITVESLLGNAPVYRCDDGFLRDVQGVFRSFKPGRLTCRALSAIATLLAAASPGKVLFLLDRPVSMSGMLAKKVELEMSNSSVQCEARTEMDVDHILKSWPDVVATADGNIVDFVEMAVDLPAGIARQMGIAVLTL